MNFLLFYLNNLNFLGAKITFSHLKYSSRRPFYRPGRPHHSPPSNGARQARTMYDMCKNREELTHGTKLLWPLSTRLRVWTATYCTLVANSCFSRYSYCLLRPHVDSLLNNFVLLEYMLSHQPIQRHKSNHQRPTNKRYEC